MVQDLIPTAAHPYLALAALVLCFAGLTRRPQAADAVVMGCLAALLITGTEPPELGLAGSSIPGVIAIAILFVVAAELRDSGAVHRLGRRLLRPPRSERHAQWMVTGPGALLSAFVNNTPIVALHLPMVRDRADRHGLTPSRLLMPLSFAAVAGGTITLLQRE